jgi:LPXTG-motif cell wall-anchored protein
MLTNKTASIVLLVVGIGLLVASLLADVIGIGDNPGFGNQQTMGTIAGVVITAAGFFFTLKKSRV